MKFFQIKFVRITSVLLVSCSLLVRTTFVFAEQVQVESSSTDPVQITSDPAVSNVSSAEEISDSANIQDVDQEANQSSQNIGIDSNSGNASSNIGTSSDSENISPGQNEPAIISTAASTTSPSSATSTSGDNSSVTETGIHVSSTTDQIATTSASTTPQTESSVPEIGNATSTNSVLEPSVATTSSSVEGNGGNTQTSGGGYDSYLASHNSASTTNNVSTISDTGNNIVSDQPASVSGTSTQELAVQDTGSSSAAVSTTTIVSTTTEGQSGQSAIITGDSYAVSDVLNFINTNILNSDTMVALLNSVAGIADIDLRTLLNGGQMDCSSCSLSTSTMASSSNSSGNSNIVASTSDAAIILNTILSKANTGGNLASTTGGSAIYTGDAYSVANVINLANTSIIDSNYTYLVLNNFGSLTGDLILPNNLFFQSFLNTTQSAAGQGGLSVNTHNAADVNNSVSSNASTGQNAATTFEGGADGVIVTGNSYSYSSLMNDVNQIHYGDNSVSLTFRVFGNWNGSIFNLPQGFQAADTPYGKEIFGTLNLDWSGSNTNYSISASNTAVIQNNIEVTAETGNNSVSGSEASIFTGNAYAAANVLNMANTTAIGRNWLGGVINIFGDWNGNISFGQPDLWVGIRADFPSGNGPGAEVVLNYVVKNLGDSPAHGVKLSSLLNSDYAAFVGDTIKNIGTLGPGEKKEIQQVMRLSDKLPAGNSELMSSVNVQAEETDGNTANNTDIVTLAVFGSGNRYAPNFMKAIPYFEMTKTSSSSKIYASSTIDFTVTVLNISGYATHAVLIDQVTDQYGNVVHEEAWDLGQVATREEITINYSSFFSSSTTPGIYKNSAWIESADGQFDKSEVGSITFEVVSYNSGNSSGRSGLLIPEKRKKEVVAKNVPEQLQNKDFSTSTEDVPVFASYVDAYGDSDKPNQTGLLANVLNAATNVPWYVQSGVLALAGLGIVFSRRKSEH